MTPDLSATRLGRDAILLTDQVAIVTGGGGGIGRGIAIAMAEFGADVAIVDINGEAAEAVAEIVRDKGRRAHVAIADMTDRDAARGAVASAIDALGKVDILVNNVGGTRPIKLVDITDRQADRQIDLNLNSLVATTQAAVRSMIARGAPGSVINVASIEGLRAAPGYSVYAACKAGMLNFTRTVALELAEHGIRVNAIAPDFVPTEHMVRFAPQILSDEAMAANARYIPLGRVGNQDDCAGAAVFLASAMAAYVTGVTISVDGGTWASSGWTRTDASPTGWRLQV